jgi:hypothetical protein
MSTDAARQLKSKGMQSQNINVFLQKKEQEVLRHKSVTVKVFSESQTGDFES